MCVLLTITFTEYGSLATISLEKLKELIDDGIEIIARAEFSGSEGCYVEVVRWNPDTVRHERFCFLKVFGGELLDNANAEETAAAIAAMVNPLTADHRLFHNFPTWNSKE